MREKYPILKEEFLSQKISLRKFCEKHKISRQIFSEYLKGNYDYHRRTAKVDDTLFEKIDTEEKAYWLGFLYADGNVHYKPEKVRYRIELGLAIKDYSHLEKFSKFLNFKGNIKLREKTKSCRIVFGSKKMCEDLIKLGCIPAKSLILTFPNSSQVPSKFIKDFLRGYFDGDGSMHLSNGNKTPDIRILGTKEFLTEIEKIYKCSVLMKDKRIQSNTYYIKFKTQESLVFLNDIYRYPGIFLTRKFEKYNTLIKARLTSKRKLNDFTNGEKSTSNGES